MALVNKIDDYPICFSFLCILARVSDSEKQNLLEYPSQIRIKGNGHGE